MSKTIKNCFYDRLTFKSMLEAHIRASIGKRKKKELILFEMDLESNLIRIMNSIRDKTYQVGSYREFKVYEPKERIIKSLPYQDRVVHQWYVEEFIKPYFFKRFIKDTYACLDGRGTHAAVETVQKYMRRMKRLYNEYYVLKCDIKKYFYSIDKEILMSILKKRINDNELLNFTKVLLDDGEDIGIPIGNYTSQYYANIYLNELDHYVKEQLRIKFYVRYMDDFIFLFKTKEEAKITLERVSLFLKNNLQLELNSKSSYFKNKKGINFCGYRIFETHILLRNRFKKKTARNVKVWKKLKFENKLNYKKFLLSFNSFKGHASHANSYNYINKLESEVKKVINN